MTGREMRDAWVRFYEEHPDAIRVAHVDLDDEAMMGAWDRLAAMATERTQRLERELREIQRLSKPGAAWPYARVTNALNGIDHV